MPARPAHQAPPRLWAPARFRALVSVVAAAAAGLTPAAVVLLPATPAYADAGDIIIEYDLEDLEAGTFTFEIRRVGPTTTPFTLDYATTTVPGAAHDATPDVDFTAISGSTVFSASTRDAVKRITVYGLTDTKDENTEVFGLALTNVTDPLNNLAVATMNDDDLPPTYSFSAAETVAENIGTVTTTATLNSLSDFPVTIPYTTANGTAAAPGDYTTTAGTLSFAPLEDTKTITVPVIDDALDEPDETFTVAASGTPTGATPSVASKTVTVTDNDTPPVVSIATAGSVREGDTLNFPVSLNVVSGQNVTVVADTANGTAVAPGDFDALSAQLVTIPAGQLSVNVPVVTKVDANDESSNPEALQVALTNPTGATLGTTPATGTITDSVATVTPVTSVTEGNSGSHNQVFDVTLSAAPSGTVEVGYTVTAGTATAGTDFDAVDGTLTYAAGQTVKQITVPVRGDTLYEGNETFDINLTSTTVGGVTGGLGPHSITIPEDDAAPTVTSVTSESVAEGSGNHNVTFTATLSNASHEAVTLDVTALGGTAVDVGAGVGSDDFDILDTSVDVAAGATTATFRVQVNGDAVYETDEPTPVTATVAGSETGATVGSNAAGTLTITNDDVVPVVVFNDFGGNEGNTTLPVTATVTGTAQAAINYTMSAANGTAEALDYTTSLVDGAIDPGETTLSDLGTVELRADTVDDAADAFQVTITPAGLVPKTANVTITDDPLDLPPKIVGTTTPNSVAEDSGPVNVPVVLNYDDTSAATTENVISVDYTSTQGTAKPILDYETASASGTLTFTPGQAAPSLDIALVDDEFFEIDETFTVTLSNDVGADSLEDDVATVTVTDDDGPAPTYSVAPVGSVTEGGAATFRVTMAAPAAVDTNFVVTHTNGNVAVSGAAAGSDFTAPGSATVTVLKDATTVDFTVQTTQDTVYEGTETATIQVDPGNGVTSVTGSAETATLTITDNDAIPTLTLNTGSPTEGNTFGITGTQTGVAERDMAYTVSVAGDSSNSADPTEGGDISVTGTPVTITGGQTPTDLALDTVTVNGDLIDENAEVFAATVRNTTVGADAGTRSYTVPDAAANMSPELVFGSPVTVAEDTGTAAIPVSKDWSALTGSGNTATSTEVTITAVAQTANGSATAPGDYTATTVSPLTFQPGDSSKNVDVPIHIDQVYELTETFTLGLSQAVGATIPAASSTVTITDDDQAARPSFSVDAATGTTVTEGGLVTYTVNLSAASVSDTDFDITLTGGNATGADFTTPPTTVQIAAGQTSAQVQVQTADDSLYEGAETRTLGIALASGENDVTGSTQNRTLTLNDNEAVPTIALVTDSDVEGQSVTVAATPDAVAERAMTYTLTIAGDVGNGGNAAENTDFNHALTTVTVPGNSAAGAPVTLGTINLDTDTIDEETETIKVTAHNDTYSATDVSGYYTIDDDPADTAPTMNLGSPVTVAEAGTNATVPVTLDFTGSSATTTEKAVSAGYSTTPGTATAAADYTATPGTVTFVAGNNTANISVPISSDTLFETNEDFTVAIASPVNATLGTATNTVTITDDDSAAIPAFTVSDPVTVAEDGGVSAQFTVTLASAAADTIDFDAAIVNGTTTTGGTTNLGKNDYTAPAADFTIAKDATSTTVTVPITNDTAYEGTETFDLQISLDSAETLATGSMAARTVTITDDESVPTLTLVGAEEAENASVAVTATTSGLAERAMSYSLTLAGDATVSGSNAAESADFTDSGVAGTVTAGTASGSTVTLRSIPLLADTVDEPVETIKVTAANTTYNTTPAVSAMYTITDDVADTAPAVTFGSGVTVAEAAGNATVPVTLDYTGSSAATTEWPVSAQYGTNSGTASAGSDYTVSSGTVSFTAGNNSSSFTVPVVSDNLFETDEQFDVTLTTPVNATLGTATNTVTITDDDSAAIPAFTVSDPVTVVEGSGTNAEFTVTLASAAAGTIDFDAAIVNGTTTTGGTTNLGKNDYTAPAADFTIAKDATTATVSIPITNDTAYEGTETFDLQVSLDSGETLATGSMAARTVTITDDESVPTLTLAGAEEAENASVAVTATTSGLAEREMSYSLTLAGDATASGSNAAESADFTDSGVAGTVTAGTASGSTVTLRSIPLLADTVDEPVETIKVTAANTTYNTTPAVSAMYTITDDVADTAPAITFGAGVPVAEGSGPATVPVTLDYTGSSAATTEWPVSADYATVAGTASAGADYTVSSGTVSFTAGNNSSSFTVPVVSDNLFETNEQFDVTLANPVNATLGTATNTVTINDDDSGAIPGFTVSDPVTVVEGTATNAVFTVTLGSAAAGTIDFDAAIVNGTTTAGGTANLGKNDYTAPAADFTIAKDQTTATVTIPITNDTAYEGAETFDVQISLDSGETLASGPLVARTVTITDDESVPTLTLSGAEAAENASVAVSATVNGLAERDMTYSLTLAGDATVSGSNAAEPADFTNNPSPTTVTGGTASGATVDLGSIPLLADTVDEPVETIKATAANTTYTSAAPASAFYTITDDVADLPPSVSVGPKTVPESIGNAAVPVTLSFGGGNDATSSEQAVSITSQLVAGTAGAGDYGNPAVQTIAAGATTGTIPVPIVNDTILESDESFQLKVTSVGPAGATIGTDAATVTITDDDVATTKPSFDVGSVSVGEGGGSATFTVTLSEAARADVDLTVAASDGSATEATGGIGGDDYDKPAGTLRIASGSRTGTFTVPVRQDTVYENDETARFTVALAQGETDAIGSARDATLSITNDDARPALSLSASAGGAEGEITSLTATIDGATQPSVNYGSLAVSTGSTGDPAETSDFKLIGGDVVVPGGTAPGTRADVAAFQLLDDTVDEAVESFDVALGTRRATVRINDDPADAAPTVAIGDESVRENAESADLQVALNFTGGTTGTERKITVPWHTIAGTAEAGGDFETSSGTATFEPGTGTVTVKVPIVGDTVGEEDEEFVVRLDAPAPNDVKLGKADGTVTVEDDDTIVKPTLNVASAVVTGEQRVRLSGTAAPGAKVELLSAANVTGTGGYKVVLSTEADDDGKFSFNPNFTQGYRLFVRANALVSPVRTVEVRQDPTITTVSSSAGAATITVTGDPDRAGQTVRIQRLTSGEWDTVATGKLTAAGTFATTQRGLRSGRSVTYRGVISASPALGILAGNSPARTVKVR
ncbi:Calx-beta domain-containing protein [Actinoplanes sp. NPDC026670]|uniref:Calx-beta domain-containing protein n=1 Tax=Actinoplanes sp. NPDC026670 TaxID=3154700 RepID=UPI00340393BA